MDLIAYLRRQQEWSRATFGEGQRTQGITKHIAKELHEIEKEPNDLMEWVDVMILAFDGAWRAGYTPAEIVAALLRKQGVNMQRKWPDTTNTPQDQPIEHVRQGEE